MPRTRRGREQPFALTKLHRLLSRLDVEKDAILAHPPILAAKIAEFHSIADNLFGPMLVTRYRQANLERPTLHGSLQDSTEYFLDELKRQQVYRLHEFVSEIEGYTDLPNHFVAVAPHVKEAVHDSGLSPTIIHPSLCILINPASFLDPGSRTSEKPCDEPFGFRTTQTLEEVGFPYINNIYATLHNGICKATYTYKLSQQVFDSSSPPPYFQGNAKKNTWFNTTHVPSHHDAANLYILCKELGDTLQAIYARNRSVYTLLPNQVCLFTNDVPLTYRCILLQVPACLAKRGASHRKTFHYHPAMESIKHQWQEAHLRALVDHNQDVMNEITRVLNHGQYYTVDRSVRFSPTSRIARILEQCLQQIRETTQRFQAIPSHTMNLPQYAKLSRLFRACRVFNQRVVNETTQSLFINPSPSSRIFPSGFGTFLMQAPQQQTGGFVRDAEQVELTEESPPYTKKSPIDYTQIDPTQEDAYPTHLYVLHGIWKQLSLQHPDWTDTFLRFRTEDIHAKLVIFFGYAEMPIWSEDFLKSIINAYDTNRLQMTHSEFADLYEPFCHAAKEGDWEWNLLEAQVEKPDMGAVLASLKPTYTRGKTRKRMRLLSNSNSSNGNKI